MELKDKIVVSPVEPIDKRKLWIHSKYMKAYMNGTWQIVGSDIELQQKVDSLDKEVGNHQTTLDKLTNGQGTLSLEIGNTTDIKNRNFAKLKKVSSEDSFFVDINYGFGTATFNSGSGGKAFILTASGHALMYTISADGSVTKTGTDIDLSNPNTEIFLIVDSLPTTGIKNKIYCVKDTKTGDTEHNNYIEYFYNTTTSKWEKIGEFKADPDLSGYAKLSGATFRGTVGFNATTDFMSITNLSGTNYIRKGLLSYDTSKRLENYVFNSNESLSNIGSQETFNFTLDNGTVVTKKIRVIETV